MDEDKLTIIIADDHHYVLQGFASILKYSPKVEVIGLINSYHETIKKTLQAKPDVLLLDLDWHSNEVPGFEAIEKIKQSAPQIAILAMTNHARLAEKARLSKADYTVIKGDIDRRELLEARIQDAYEMCKLKQAKNLFEQRPKEKFTNAEKEVFELLTNGLSNQKIADLRKTELSTIKSQVSDILGKLGVKSRAEAIAFMQKNNLTVDDL